MGTKFLKPASPEVLVRDPSTKVPLSNSGEHKPWEGTAGSYWRRRVMDKSVLIVDVPVAKVEEGTASGDSPVQFSKKERGK